MFKKNVVEKIKTHLMLSIFLFENPAIYGIIWEKIFYSGADHI